MLSRRSPAQRRTYRRGRHRHRARHSPRRTALLLVTRIAGAAAALLTLLIILVLPHLDSAVPVEIGLRNGGFETGGASAAAAGWTDYSTGGHLGAAYTEVGGSTGRYRLSHWSATAYQVETYQYLTRLTRGTYTLWAWVRSSGGQNTAYIALRNCGDSEARTALPTSRTWHRISVTADVSAGHCTISLVSEGKPGTWANFDDVRLSRTAGRTSDLALPVTSKASVVALVAVSTVVGLTMASRRMLRPVQALTRAVRRLGAGQRWEQIEVHGNDDVAELTRTFNSMAASLQNGEERQRRMVADVAHELRTPLSTVRSHLEALIDGVLPARPEVFVSLHEEAMLQQRIVDDLQDLALAEAGALTYRKDPVDVRDLLESTRRALAVQAGHAGVRLVVATAGRPQVYADADRIRQVVGNLAGNALRYTPTGGIITLSCAVSGADTVIEVTDTGCGIAPDDLPHVFDRFWRAGSARRRTSAGSGLGLAIARQIVTDHDGDISVRSRVGQGTTFTVRLPRAVPAGSRPVVTAAGRDG